MNSVCALDVQDTLKGESFISIPWIQLKYELGYPQARRFLEQLIIRGWIEKLPIGVQYAVKKENLLLRKIKRTEIDKIIEDITYDCMYVIEAVQKRSSQGVSFSELSHVVRGEDAAKEALKILTELNLIYYYDERFFSCVSRVTNEVLSNVVKMKRSNELSKRITGKKDDVEKTAKLFDPLFDDE